MTTTASSRTAIPGAEWLLDWRYGKKSVQENWMTLPVEDMRTIGTDEVCEGVRA